MRPRYRSAGLAPRSAVTRPRSTGISPAWTRFVLAFSAVDADYLARPAQQRQADTQRWQDAYGAVDAARYPNLAALGPVVVQHAGMSAFESCLALLLDTFERLAPPHAGGVLV